MEIRDISKLSFKVEVDQTEVDECLEKCREIERIYDKVNGIMGNQEENKEHFQGFKVVN